MKRFLLIIVAFVCLLTASGMAQANEPQCSKGTCYGLGVPSGLCYLGGVYTQIDAAAGHNLWACTTKNGVSGWTLQVGSGGSSTGSSGAVQGSDGAGAFTDTGVSVSSGNVSVGAGKSVGSADTGTPKFTFSTNLITANQPLNVNGAISAGTSPAGIANTANGGFGATEAASTGWTPTTTTSWMRFDSTTHKPKCSFNGAAEIDCSPAANTTSTANQFFTAFNAATGAFTKAAIVAADLPTNVPRRGIAFSIGDPAGSALSAASTTTAYVTVPFACTISAYNLAIDAGTITVKFWKKATGTAIPTSSDSINTSGVAIASGTAIHSTTVSDFTTTAVSQNDIVAMNVTTVATAKYVSGVLQCDQ